MTDEQAITTYNQTTAVDPYERVANRMGGRSYITGDLLRFTKRGEYRAGQNKELIPQGTRMLAYMPALKEGWVRWQDGMPQQHIIGLVSEGFVSPDRETLGDQDRSLWPRLGKDPNDPWQFTQYLVMCDQQGQLFTYVTSSKGGFGSISGLCKLYAGHRRMKPDEIPVIELHSRPWEHVDYGEMIAPDLKIVGWSKIPDTFEEVASSLAAEQSTPGSDSEPDLFEGGTPLVEQDVETEVVEEWNEFADAPAPEPEPEPEPVPVKAKARLVPKTAAKPAPTQKAKRNGGKTLRF